MAVVELRTRTVVGRQRVTHAMRAHRRRGLQACIRAPSVPHRGRGACLVSDTPGVGREPLSSSTFPP